MIQSVVKLVLKLFKKSAPLGPKRADMYLPLWLLIFGLLLVACGVGCGVYALVSFTVGFVIAAPICLILGITAILCWRNQKITILSDETFEYSTFLGKKTVYRFDEIKGIRKNSDSMTMFVGDGKVHIESAAVMTKALTERLNRQLALMYGQSEE